MTKQHLSETEYKVLTDACACACGAARYLQHDAIATLMRLKLVEVRNEHSVIATPRGREVWHALGAL